MWSCITNSAEYIYSHLQMKSYDEMLAEVKKRVISAERSSAEDLDEAKSKLKDALQLIFSRPNPDNMVSQLVPTVRVPLRNIEAYESVIEEIAVKAINTTKNKKGSTAQQATGLIILENIMSELKPDVKSNKNVHSIFAQIRDAKIEVSDKIKKELRMRAMMKAPPSPSALAKQIIGPVK